MKRILSFVPISGIVGFILVGKLFRFDIPIMRLATLIILAANAMALYHLHRQKDASHIHKGMASCILLAALAFWIWPEGLGRLIAKYPASAIYAVLFFVAIGPPILGREVFTMFFARKTTPKAVCETDIFLRINQPLTIIWAVLFFLGALSGLVPGFFGLQGPIYETLFEGLLPAALMLGLGLPMNKKYPWYYQRKLGLTPIGQKVRVDEGDSRPQQTLQAQPFIEKSKPFNESEGVQNMSDIQTIVAVNGSPHAGIGNTSLMIEMLRDPLSREGFDLKVINLSEHEIEYCTGCAFCLEKGNCWIDDDHKSITKKLLAADGIILASPVYVMNVPGQMKTFIDRCLALGHKPRPTWRPGLAVSVSAGLAETQVVQYLAAVLRPFGAFPVGTFTAIATGIGEFLGKEAVEARAMDLAGDLTRAIKEKRRYPVTDQDLRFYLFMGDLVKRYKDTIMKHDHKHWEKHGLHDGFESYVQQKTVEVAFDSKVREAWIKGMIAEREEKKRAKEVKVKKEQAPAAGPKAAKTCKELFRIMPLGFKPDAAEGLSATYQFQVSGSEDFVAYLQIEEGKCTFHEGQADSPSVVIKTPADVWLAIAKGEMNGQQAFMSGKYKVEGDLSLLMKLSQLFGR
ncbi:MAG: NAD(P)H-dependent oxidoreductase [Desulfobacteraceae bacterium]|jgi:multimeric flavodoxin WrbA/putative sterol carrier protein